MPVNVNVIASAKLADLQFRASAITKGVTLEIGGNSGVQTLSFVSGTTASAIAFAVNRISDSTGVTASLINAANANSGIALESTGFGSSSFVSIQAQSGTFKTTDATGSAKQRIRRRRCGRDHQWRASPSATGRNCSSTPPLSIWI